MHPDGPTGERAFALLVAELADAPGVTLPGQPGSHTFGANALKVSGSIFAMLVGDRLVLKLPRTRVEELLEAGAGTPFEASGGRPMKEWIAVRPTEPERCLALGREALTFVREVPKGPTKRRSSSPKPRAASD